MTNARLAVVRKLNDLFRTTFIGGKVLMTSGVAELPEAEKAEVLTKVREFNTFNEDNDPYHDHDFGAFDVGHQKFFFKIDYYDKDETYGSEDPADASKTNRVLTIMKAEEY